MVIVGKRAMVVVGERVYLMSEVPQFEPHVDIKCVGGPFGRRSRVYRRTGASNSFISHNIFIDQFQKVKPPTKSSASCLSKLLRILSRRFCGGVDFGPMRPTELDSPQ